MSRTETQHGSNALSPPGPAVSFLLYFSIRQTQFDPINRFFSSLIFRVKGGFGEGRAWLIIIIMAVSGLQGAGQEAIRFWEAAAALFFGFRLRLEGSGDACL
ncbi:hypothetical protein VitviT2T_019102 [Vitis vinifera]|uniref:Uncharacterized protein n=1 Tax=Vitis vinifera TaxID=29760 RepID=A0ABY9D065_VITVI|nr:hypothetical protein VitviT2T_019102 [Vitis vinifera]